MNIIAPLAWTAIASLDAGQGRQGLARPARLQVAAGKQGTSKILLTQGTGKLAVNVSKAATTSVFVKALNVIMQGAKIAAPLVTLPAISVPALSAFTEALSYWEDRTRFLMAGNLTTAVATQQALERSRSRRPLHRPALRRLPDGSAEAYRRSGQGIAEPDLVQGYLVRKDADPNLPLAVRAQNALPGITYASMRVSVVAARCLDSVGDRSQQEAPQYQHFLPIPAVQHSKKRQKEESNERPLSAT